MVKLEPVLTQILSEHAYVVEYGDNSVRITNPLNTSVIELISLLSGILVVILGGFIGYEVVIMGIILIFGPFVSQKWRYPQGITFDRTNYIIKIRNNSFIRQIIKFNQISDITVERYTNSTFVSSFEEGNQEFIYDFYLNKISGNKIKLIKLNSRKEIDKAMQQIALFLNKTLKEEMITF